LPGHALPQYREGSFGDDFSDDAGNGFGYDIFGNTGLGSGTVQQVD
jgi:hypothetical protein